MPRGADAENIPPFVPTRDVKTRPLSHYPRVSGLVRQRRRHAARSANTSALNISTNTYAPEDIPLVFSGSLIVESMSPKPAPTMTGLATPPASQTTVPTRLPMSPPPGEEIIKQRTPNYATTPFPATRNTSTVKLQSSTAPVKSRKRARSVTTYDEEDTSPKTKSRKQAKAKVVPPMLAGTKRPRHSPSPGVPSFVDDMPVITTPNPAPKQLRKLVEPDTPIRPSASTNVPRTEFVDRRKSTSVDVARRRRRTVSPLRIRPLPPPDPRTFKPPPPPSPSDDPLLLKGSKRRRRVRRSDMKHPHLGPPTRASKDKGRMSSSSSVHTHRVGDYRQDMSVGFNDTFEWDDQPTNDYVVPLKFNLSSSSQRNQSTNPESAARLASPYPLVKMTKGNPLPVRSPLAEENEFWGTTHDMAHGPPSDDSDNEELVPVPSLLEFQIRAKSPSTLTSPVTMSTARERTPPPAENILLRARAPTPRRKTLSERMAELGTKLGGEGSSFRAPAKFTELDALPSGSPSPVKEDLTPPSDELAEAITQDQDSVLDLAPQGEHSVVVVNAAEEMESVKEVEFPLLVGPRPNENNDTSSIGQSFDQSLADPSVEQSLDVSQDISSPSPRDELSNHNRPHSAMLKRPTAKATLSDLPTEISTPPRFEFQSPTSHVVKPSPFFHHTPMQKQFQPAHQHFGFDSQAPTPSSLHFINIPAITPQSQHQDNFNNGTDKTMEVVEAFEDHDESSWEGEDEDGEPLVHVSSKNPMAAARAAAILKLHHDYIEGSQRKEQCTPSFGSVRKHTPSIRGSPALLRRVETELATPLKGGAANCSFGSIGNTSIRAVPTTVDFAIQTGNETRDELSRDGQEEYVEDEERVDEEEGREPTPLSTAPWTKNEWRLLEQCFTDVRDDLACALDVVEVDVDEIDLNEVVQRFMDVNEGKHELVGDWAWNKIRRRAFALKGRQRSGAARNLEVFSPAQLLFRTSSVEPQACVRPLPAPTPTRSNNAPVSTSFTTPKPTLGPIPIIREIAATPTPVPTRRTQTDMPPPSFLPVKATMPPPPSPSPALIPASKPAPTSIATTTLELSKSYVIPPSTPLGPTIRDQPSSASKRVWDWMGSFLIRTPQSSAKRPTPNPVSLYPVLPPVSDGDRDALKHIEPPPPRSPEKVVHPKDQVQLQHVPTPDSARPPPKIKLNHKGSSGSVRDLVKGFEGLQDEKRKEEKRKHDLAIKGEVAKLKRMGSGGSLRSHMSGYASSATGDTIGNASRDGRNTSFNTSYESSSSLDNSASWIRR